MINLKRWVALALSLCLLMTGFALAEGIEITNEAVEEVESTNVDAATDEVVFELTGPDEGAVEIEPLQEDGLDRNDDSAATVSAVESTYGVDLQSDYYVSSVNPFYKKGYKGECTWYCWGRAYEKCGVKLSWSNDGTFGNAKYWYSNAKAWAENHEASYTTGTEPRENSIAVSTSGTYGHVVFIEEIANGKVYYSECNYTGPGVYNEGVKALNALPYVGYIYLGIPVTAAYFPDAGFRSYVSKHFDTDKNGWLSDAERDAVDHIYMNGEKGISDLAGIKCFKNLYELYCADCGLTSLDVSGCRELTILVCSGNKLKTLDISGTSIWRLRCYDNRLKKLVLNELCEDLYCYGNKLSELDISKSEELVGLRECVEEMEDGKSSRKVSSKGVIRYDSEHTMATLAFDAYTRLIIDGKKVDGWKNVPTSVKLNKSGTAQLKMTGTLKLKATIEPKQAVPILIWKSSNKKIAKVSDGGVVTPVKPGTATIQASTYNGKTAKVKVKVVAVKPTKVKITKGSKATMRVGDKLKLKAKLYPTGVTSKLTWKSSDKKVAAVSSKGVVTAKKKGKATITVKTANGKKAKIKITVKAKRVELAGYYEEGDVSSFAKRFGFKVESETTLREFTDQERKEWAGYDINDYYIKHMWCGNSKVLVGGYATADTKKEISGIKNTCIEYVTVNSSDFTLFGVWVGMDVNAAKKTALAQLKKRYPNRDVYVDLEDDGNLSIDNGAPIGQYYIKNGKVSGAHISFPMGFI